MTLEVKALGRPDLRLMGGPVALGGKTLALLYRLAVRPAPRAEATALLWGDDGAQSLRQALVVLRKLPAAEGWLEDGEPLDLRAAVDSRAFEAAVQSGDMARAVALYEGRLLQDFNLPRAPAFQDWLEVERARFEHLLGLALRSEALRLETETPVTALAHLERLLGLDPLDESAVQMALRLELALGRRDAARARLAVFRRTLRAELDADPLPETVALLGTTGVPGPGSSRDPAPAPPGAALSSLALRLSRARSLEPELRDDASFWAEVLEVDAFALAEAASELETVPPDSLELPASVRALLHRRIAAALESRPAQAERSEPEAPEAVSRAVRLGHHWLSALEPRAALPHWQRASSLALRFGRIEEAQVAAYRALWITESEPARREALLALGAIADAKHDLGLMGDISAELLRLGAQLQDDLALFHGQQRRAAWLVRSARAPEAIEAALVALGIAERLRDPELIALAQGASGTAHMAAGQLLPARAALLIAAEAENPQLRLRSLANLGSVAGMLGQLEEALGHLEAALTISRATQNLSVTCMVLYNLGATAEKLGVPERAEAGFREAVQIAERIGNAAILLQGTLALAKLHAGRGHWGAAFNTASEALELARGSPLKTQAQYLLGELEARCGRLDAASQHYAAALAGFQAAGNARLSLSVTASAGLLAWQRGDAGAEAGLREALKALRDAGHQDQFDHIRLEYALVASDAQAIRWALEGLPEDQLAVRIAWARLELLEPTSFDVAAFQSQLEAALSAEQYSELALGYAVLAAHLELNGDSAAAETARAQSRRVRQESAAGLPKTQRVAYLESSSA